MSADRSIRRGGGLLLSGSAALVAGEAPLRAGADVSWLPRCRVGDDQGESSACVLFSFASWSEIVHGHEIPDTACIWLWRQTLQGLGRVGGGMSFQEGFEAAKGAGWLPGCRGLQSVGNLTALPVQPVLAGYSVTGAFDQPNLAGCLDHSANGAARGSHAVVIVAHGQLHDVEAGPWVYIENSWGREWGWKGIGVMAESLHRQLCRELWVIQ
jgi:hypothetical protein